MSRSKTIVKICGIDSPDALAAALDAGADMVGFVVFPPSPRHLGHERLREFGARGPLAARKVLLTVDAADQVLDEAVAALKPDLLQLHGSEPPDRVAALRERFGLPAMKAIGVARRSDLGLADAYRGVAEMVLLDAKPDPDATRPGGNGRAFDWALTAGFRHSGGWLLSGGLTCDNVGEALAKSGALGVDVSSGVESAPGKKDPDLIRKFIGAVRWDDSLAWPKTPA